MTKGVPPAEALNRLREGNQRFVSDTRSIAALASQLTRGQLASGQEPFATILSCSDSRAPAETLFDQGLGDLFVIRVAGNIVAPSLVGSVEFASAAFGTRLVVVMGHSSCGAIKATVDAVRDGGAIASDNIRDIVDRIRPTVQSLLEANPDLPYDRLVQFAVRANVRASADDLRHGSRILEDMVRSGQVVIVGAEYSLETGIVDFFDVPDNIEKV